MVGAYVLTKVTDPEATTPDHQVPEYVTVLNAPEVRPALRLRPGARLYMEHQEASL